MKSQKAQKQQKLQAEEDLKQENNSYESIVKERREQHYKPPVTWIDSGLRTTNLRKTLEAKESELTVSPEFKKSIGIYEHEETILRRIEVLRGYNEWLQVEQPVWKVLVHIQGIDRQLEQLKKERDIVERDKKRDNEVWPPSRKY
jgi:hypothetical protein